MAQLDVDQLPEGWTAELTDVFVNGILSDDITTAYRLRKGETNASLTLFPGAFTLAESTTAELRRGGEVIEAQRANAGRTLAWAELDDTSALLSGDLSPGELLALASDLHIVLGDPAGATRPEDSGPIRRASVMLEGTADGLSWRLLVGGTGLTIGLEVDGILPEFSEYGDDSISSVRGSASATVVSVDGTRFILVVSSERDDRVGLAHRDGTRTTFPSVILADGKLTLTPIAVPADIAADVVSVWNDRIGRELRVELPPLPRTGWARGQGSNVLPLFFDD
ncbi:MAG: hypothetical protein AAGD18_01600 [Actinomycetota bacterium]